MKLTRFVLFSRRPPPRSKISFKLKSHLSLNPSRFTTIKIKKIFIICDYFMLFINIKNHEMNSCVIYVVKKFNNKMIVDKSFFQTYGGIIDHAAG